MMADRKKKLDRSTCLYDMCDKAMLNVSQIEAQRLTSGSQENNFQKFKKDEG